MNALDYARELIAFDSTCHRSNRAVSDYVENALERLNFFTERIEYADSNGEQKVCVIGRRGEGPGGLAYFGHTDVVPADEWAADHGPFDPLVREGRLYGRGSTDMKGSIACMLAAAEALNETPLRQPLVISCTADEEINHRGAVEIVRESRLYRELVDGGARAIVGEPTGMRVVYAHKGGCHFRVTSRGRAAHSSTRQGLNANLAMIPFLEEMKRIHDETEREDRWRDDEFDPPTICWNIGINDHTRAINITAPQSIATVGFRPMPGTATDELLERARRCADRCGLEFQLGARHAAFRTDPQGPFAQLALRLCECERPLTVGYGTEASNLEGLAEMIVLGPGDIRQAHTADEWVALEQLEKATTIYGRLVEATCS